LHAGRRARYKGAVRAVIPALLIALAACRPQRPDPTWDPARPAVRARIDLARVWAAVTDEDLESLSLGRSCCVGPDGTLFLTSPLGLVAFALDDPGSARLLREEADGRLGPLDVSPDGTRLAIGYLDEPRWEVLELRGAPATAPAGARSTIEDATDEADHVWFLAWRTNDELLAWTRNRIRCIDVRRNRTLWTREAGSGYVVASRNREFVLVPSLSSNESVVLRARDGHEVARFRIDPPETNLFGAVSDDGRCAVVGRYRHDRIHCWRADREGVETFAVPGSRSDSGAGFAFLPGTHRLLVFWPESMFLVDADAGRVEGWCDVAPAIGLEFGPSFGMKVTPAGRCLLLTDRDLLVIGRRE